MSSLLSAFRRASAAYDRLLLRAIYAANSPQPPFPGVAVAAVAASNPQTQTQTAISAPMSVSDLLESFGIVFVMGRNGSPTQKHRKSLERRKGEDFCGAKWGTQKFMKPTRRIRFDHETLEPYELGKMAPRAYRAVMDETEAIQKRMKDAFGMRPKNREVIVLYEGETSTESDSLQNKLPVEMEKERPAFFSKNLMQRATTGRSLPHSSDSGGNVRPTGLG